MNAVGAPGAFHRPVSPIEWWLVGHPTAATPTIQLVVEGRGSLGHERLRAAVAAAGASCPGTRLVRRGRIWMDSGRDVPVRLLAPQDAAGAPHLLDRPELMRPLSGDGGPHCEVLLVEGARPTVVFRVSHEVMDGAGLLTWAGEVFRALRGETLLGAADPTSEADILEEAGARPRKTQPGESAPLLGRRTPRGGAPRFHWQRRTVDGYHPALVAKAATAIAAWTGEQSVRFSVPVDLRRHSPGTRTTANASQSVQIDVAAGGTWEDVQEQLVGMLAEQRELFDRLDPAFLKTPRPLLSLLNRMADGRVVKTGRYPAAAAVSHLGRVDPDDFRTADFEPAYAYPLTTLPLCGPPELNMLESGGHTEITIAYHDSPAARDLAAQVLDRIEEALSPRARRVLPSNDTGRAYEPATLTGLFAAQVQRTPDAVAVSAEDGDTTYAELDRRARAIAAALHARGTGRGDRVGLIAGRTTTAIAAVWGILKTGAAYLPIDASYPSARVLGLLTDAGSSVCLYEPGTQPQAPLPDGCTGIDLGEVPAEPPADWQDIAAGPDDVANIIYTSGSTGAPKASQIEHRALVNYVHWVTREARIDAGTRMPLVASISFDMAGCAIFLPLLSGGAVLPVREVDALSLRAVLEDRGATAFSITPSHLDLINRCGVQRNSVRVVMTAGELLRRSTALRALEALGPDLRILCQWGPSETTIVNTSHEFDPERDTAAGVPFGPPMDNNTMYVLDEAGRFVEPGEPGEAYVGGVQLARGYLNRPELTRQRFVRLADGTRVYKTGDIVRMVPFGGYAFVGRADDQVKIRGHRIEPAEVAQALEGHAAIRQAAVAARNRPGREEPELCAYVVAPEGVDQAEVKAFLRDRLPAYLVPAVIVAVPEIPRNANGKTDVRGLPDPFAAAAPGAVAGPRLDGTAAAVAEIWRRVLGTGSAPLDEHSEFALLGGNSVLLLTMVDEVAVRVVGAAARDSFLAGLGQIIREPTLGRVAELARKAESLS